MPTVADSRVAEARATLDAWVRELMQWHFDPATGCPFWLDWAARAGWDPRTEVRGYDDLARFGADGLSFHSVMANSGCVAHRIGGCNATDAVISRLVKARRVTRRR